MAVKNDLKQILKGTVSDTPRVREKYSRDASTFAVLPDVIVTPKDKKDIKNLIEYVLTHKNEQPNLSITLRGAGTNTAGASLNDSIIVDLNKHFARIYSIGTKSARVQPGVTVATFNKQARKKQAVLPFTQENDVVSTLGGLIASNASSGRATPYATAAQAVTQLKAILADGNEYTFYPLSKKELERKMKLQGFEGELYTKLFKIFDRHYTRIKNAKPSTVRNAMGYNIWEVWDRERGVFDLTKLLVGSMGTLGVVTEVSTHTSPRPQQTDVLEFTTYDVAFVSRLHTLLRDRKEVIEVSFLQLPTKQQAVLRGQKFRKELGIVSALLATKSLPVSSIQLKVSIRYGAKNKEALRQARKQLLTLFGDAQIVVDDSAAQKVTDILAAEWQQREILQGMADFALPPHSLLDALPEAVRILRMYKLPAIVAGDALSGHMTVVGLQKISPRRKAAIQSARKEINKLVLRFNGSLAVENGDAMAQGVLLESMYGPEINRVFKRIKTAFDPHNIFNPHKKIDASKEWNESHITAK